MGQVAIHAAGRVVVGTLRPGGVFVVHDVAVGAGARIGGEVAEAFSAPERERPYVGGHADGRHDQQSEGYGAPVLADERWESSNWSPLRRRVARVGWSGTQEMVAGG